MKTQIFTSLFLAVLLMSVLSVAAASFTVSPTSTIAFNQPATSKTVTLSVSPTINLTNITGSIVPISDDSSTFTVTPVLTGASDLVNTTTSSVSLALSSTVDYSKMTVGKTYSGNLVLIANGVDSDNQTIPVSFAKSFCDYGENGTNLIEIKDIEEDEDFEWNPLDEITVDVEVENKGDSREKVTVELGLYDSVEEEFVEIDGNDDILEQSIRIDDGDEEVFSFTFKVSPELEEDTDDRYRLYVKAYLDTDEAEACVSGFNSLFEDVEINYDDEEVVIDNIQSPDTMSCGFVDKVSMDVYNLDYGDDEDFRVNLYNTELGIDMNSDIFTLDNGESEQIEFELKLPSSATAKSYKIYAIVEYNYKSSSDSFFDQSDEYYFTLNLENCEAPEAVITAELSSETPRAIIGSQVIIEATIKNTGTGSATYSMSLSGNSAWSEAAEIDPASFTLAAGETKKVKIYLDIDAEAEEGDKEFTITSTYNGISANQKVLLTLEKGFSTSKLANHFKEYWFIYVIGLITLILLIVVILLLVRKSD